MTRYRMVGKDLNSFSFEYRTWIANAPDLDGYYYTGDKSGNLPFEDVVAYVIYDGYTVADFNLPLPLAWETVPKTLPNSFVYTHLATIDGYIYMFGGQITDKIFRTTTANPTNFIDTGYTLPTPLYDGSIAVIDGYIYIFGGNDGYTTVDTIFSAPTSNPLNWTNHGSLLPHKLQSSQLAIINNSIYIFGGISQNQALDIILSAPTTNPLNWANTNAHLPLSLYNSHIGLIDGYVYLFGGQFNDELSINYIFRAEFINIFSWLPYATLPYNIAGGNFFTIGDKGYLITPAANENETFYQSFNKILRCNLTSPGQWIDTQKMVPSSVAQSKLAIINDRLFLYGGNGSSAIFACKQQTKYDFNSAGVINYGDITRTQYQAADEDDLFEVLGFAPWLTNYKK